MKLLVFGRSGQVGRALADAAPARAIDLVALARAQADLTRADEVTAAVESEMPDVVVNAAAFTGVDQAEGEADGARAVNTTGAGLVALACDARSIPLIHLSTDYVFDGTRERPYREDDPAAPLGVYGQTKLGGERLVAASCERHVILRTAWVFSAHGRNFARTMLRLASEREEIAVVDDQSGSPTHAGDLAAAILDLAGRILTGDGTARWGLYHAAGAGETTWCGLAREIFAVSERCGGPAARVRAITSMDYPTPARRPANSRLDCGKLERAFGIRLAHWRSGVEACVAAMAASGMFEDKILR